MLGIFSHLRQKPFKKSSVTKLPLLIFFKLLTKPTQKTLCIILRTIMNPESSHSQIHVNDENSSFNIIFILNIYIKSLFSIFLLA